MATVGGFESSTSTYSWYLCSNAVVAGTQVKPGDCNLVAGSEDQDLLVTSSMVGKRLTVMQTASNNQGEAKRFSATTDPITSTPSLVEDPPLSGSDTAGSTVQVYQGMWAGNPNPSGGVYTYDWFLCPESSQASNTLPDGCEPGSVGSGTGISISRAWDGKHLVAKETLTLTTNLGVETRSRYTAGFGPLKASPNNTVAPQAVVSQVRVGATVTAQIGTWTSNTNPISYSYRWWVCNSSQVSLASNTPPSGCSEISGYDNSNLVILGAHLNKYIVLVVTATNAGGSSVKSSVSTGQVQAQAAARLSILSGY
jgi:hypothetical protein